jgi:osmotically-inducible protein OsmY
MSRLLVTALGLSAALAISITPAIAASPFGMLADQTAKQTDKALQERIEYRLEVNDAVAKYDIKVKVDAGMATLSGDVATLAQKTEAGRLARIDGISMVHNNVTVNPDADKTVAERVKKGLNKSGEAITDAWITTKMHWFFIGEDSLKDSNINVDTKDNVVTLKGTVKTKAGRDRAVVLAKRCDGVKSVVDQLEIK